MGIVLTSRFNTSCILCNNVPTDESSEDNRPLEMLHAEGVHVNWNEDANICQVCAGVMADLLGRPSTEKVVDLAGKYAVEKGRREAAETHAAELQNRIDRMIDGKKALKEAKEAA